MEYKTAFQNLDSLVLSCQEERTEKKGNTKNIKEINNEAQTNCETPLFFAIE